MTITQLFQKRSQGRTFVSLKINDRSPGVDLEAQPSIDFRQCGLLPTQGASKGQKEGQKKTSRLRRGGCAEEPAEVVNKDEAPVHLGKGGIAQTEQERCHPTPIELCARHAIGAHRVDPPFVVQLCNLESPLIRQDLDPPVGLGDIRFQH